MSAGRCRPGNRSAVSSHAGNDMATDDPESGGARFGSSGSAAPPRQAACRTIVDAGDRAVACGAAMIRRFAARASASPRGFGCSTYRPEPIDHPDLLITRFDIIRFSPPLGATRFTSRAHRCARGWNRSMMRSLVSLLAEVAAAGTPHAIASPVRARDGADRSPARAVVGKAAPRPAHGG
jgi:hypothetical protein